MSLEVVASRIGADEICSTTDVMPALNGATSYPDTLETTGEWSPVVLGESESQTEETAWVAHEDKKFVMGLAGALVARRASGNYEPYHVDHITFLYNSLIENPTADIVTDVTEAFSKMRFPTAKSKDPEDLEKKDDIERWHTILIAPETAAYMVEDYAAERILTPIVKAVAQLHNPEVAQRIRQQNIASTYASIRMAKIRGDVQAVSDLEAHLETLIKSPR